MKNNKICIKIKNMIQVMNLEQLIYLLFLRKTHFIFYPLKKIKEEKWTEELAIVHYWNIFIIYRVN